MQYLEQDIKLPTNNVEPEQFVATRTYVADIKVGDILLLPSYNPQSKQLELDVEITVEKITQWNGYFRRFYCGDSYYLYHEDDTVLRISSNSNPEIKIPWWKKIITAVINWLMEKSI